MEQKFIVAVSEHRLFGFLILPFLAEEDVEKNYISISHRLRVHDLTSGSFSFTPVQAQLVKLTEKYADDVLAKKYNKKGTLNDFYKNIRTEDFTKKLVPYVGEIMVRCLDILKNAGIPVYFKRAKYTNLYDEDLIELCYEDTTAVFNFHKLDDETRYFLTIRHGKDQLSLLHRNIILLVNDPCRILYQNKLYYFDDITGLKLQPFFEKEFISIPRRLEEKYFTTFILSAVKSQEINYSGFEIIDIPARKEAILSVAVDITGYPVFIPEFKYNDHTIKSNDDGKKVAALEISDANYVFRRFEKDAAWESDLIARLRALGLQGETHSLHLSNPVQENQDEAFYQAINWISQHVTQLEEYGIRISQDHLEHTYFTGLQQLDIKAKRSHDWFDIYAMVTFGEFTFPFIRLRKNILNQIREFILPDGQIAILPLEWFAKYRNIFSFGKMGEHSIRLQNFHYMLIAEIAGETDNTLKERIEAMNGNCLRAQEVPAELCAELRHYQYEGYNWLHHLYANGFGGCLADDMGLGKTIQTLTLLLRIKRKEQVYPVFQHKKSGQLSLFATEEETAAVIQPASLIVLPVSLVHNWEKEIRKFAPALRMYVYSGARRREKGSLYDLLVNYDIILTTYGTVRNDTDEFSQHEFFFLILDESQNIKNSESKTYHTVTALRSQHRIVLTGTPIENSLTDLWAQMNFINRGLLGSKKYFQQEFLIPIERDKSTDASEKLQHLIQPFILRRTKEQVAKDLPSLTEETIVVAMTSEQSDLYETEKSAARNSVLAGYQETTLRKSTFLILQALTRLRQIAIHPRLIDPESVFESGKFQEIISMLRILVAENHKILVFSSFVKHLNLLAGEFDRENWNYSVLTGQTIDRKQVIDEFQENPDKRIFLISLKAGGVGLNLTAADYIFITDPWWNPAAEMQAISRAHRIGQDKKVFVYRFISEKSIEEKIQLLQERKSVLANEFINNNDALRNIPKEQIMDLFD